MTPKLKRAKARVERAAMRWHSYHCEQLSKGSCSECTRFFKVVADLDKLTKGKK